MSKWKPTTAKGVRYWEHETRKHGAMPDRFFCIRYKVGGKSVEEACGWASEGWTQTKAADHRAEMIMSARAGGPKTRREKRVIEAKEITFEEAFQEYWDNELSKIKSSGEGKRIILKDVMPLWKDRPVKSITRRDIVLLRDRIRDKGVKVYQNRVISRLTRFFNFMAERGILDSSPAVNIRKDTEISRERALNDIEIKAFWNAIDINNKGIDIHPVTRLALRLILLTGCRANEVCKAEWTEFDIQSGIWIIPGERMKARREHKRDHLIPLTPLMLETLEQIKTFSSPQSNYLFIIPGNSKPVDPHTLRRAIERHYKEIGIKEHFCTHDLRRTVRTKLAEIGIDDVIAERVIAHELPGILKVYNRHGYLNEKREALLRWENRLKEITGQTPTDSNGKIIEISKYRTGAGGR